jgi:hypothetical protein
MRDIERCVSEGQRRERRGGQAGIAFSAATIDDVTEDIAFAV